MKDSPLKLVLIGCGQIGMAAHLPILKMLEQEGHVEIVGVCDADAAKGKLAAEKFEIPDFDTN